MAKTSPTKKTTAPKTEGRSALLTALRVQKKELQQMRFTSAIPGRSKGTRRVLRRRSARTLTALAASKKTSQK